MSKIYTKFEDWVLKGLSDDAYWRARRPFRFVIAAVAAVAVSFFVVWDILPVYADMALLGLITLVVAGRYLLKTRELPLPDESRFHYIDSPDPEATQPLDMRAIGMNVQDEHPSPPSPAHVSASSRYVRVPRKLRKLLHGGEQIELVRRLHYLKLTPSLVVTIGTFGAIYYIPNQPKKDMIWMVLMLVAFGVIIGFPIYRRIRWFMKVTRWWHLLIAGAILVILLGLLRNNLVAIGSWIADAVVRLLHVLNLDQISLTTLITAMFWIALSQFTIRLIEWWINPAVVTNRRLIVVHGLIIHSYPGTVLQKLTDETPQLYGPLPFATLRVETSGQDQGLDKIHWFPLALFSQIKTSAPSPS